MEEVSAEPHPRALTRLFRLDFAIAGGRAGVQGGQEPPCRVCDFTDRAVEGGLIGLRRPAETGQLSHELQRRSADLVLCRGRLEIEQRLDVAAHFSSLPGAVRRPSKERSTEPKSYIDRANCHKVSGDVTLYAGSR